MKNFNKIFFAAVAAAFGLVSCSQELTPVEKPQGNLVTVNFGAEASIEPATKATLTTEDELTFKSAWENGDIMSVNYSNGNKANGTVPATWNASSQAFEATLPEYTGMWDYNTVYPAPDADGKVDFGSVRTQKGNAYNSNYDLMKGAAIAENAAAGKDDNGKNIIFEMTRQTAVAYFHLTGTLDEEVVSAKLSVEGDGAYISTSDVKANEDYAKGYVFTETEGVASKEINLTFDAGTAPKASDFKLWFNVLPTIYTKMTLTVETANHTMTISRTAEDMDMYDAGKLYKVVKAIPADKWVKKGGDTPVAKDFALVTSALSDWSGSYLLVGEYSTTTTPKSSSYYAFDESVYVNSSWGKCSEVVVENNTIASTYGGMALDVVPGTTENTYSILTPSGKYLSASAKGAFNLLDKYSATNCDFTISFGENNAIIIKQASSTKNRQIRYNHNDGNGGLRWYDGTTGKPVYLYKGPSVTKYSVSCSTVEGGKIAASLSRAEAGAEVTLTVTPAEGYAFNEWSVKGADETVIEVVDNKFTMPAQNVTVSGTFSKVAYTITKAAAENGSFIVKNGNAEVTTAFKGDKLTLEATPAEGFTFGTWTVTYMDGGTEKTVYVNADAFYMPAANVTVSASFVKEAVVPVYASVAELIAVGKPTTTGTKVTVTLTDEEITKFYKSGTYTNGVYFIVGTQEVQIYCRNTPSDWKVGGTISGTLTNCDWKLYKSTWELCPADYSELTYKAPLPSCATPVITIAEDGVVSIACETAGATIHYTVGDSPADPTEADAVFSAATLTDGQTIKAIAVAEGFKPSAIASKKYIAGGTVVLYTLNPIKGKNSAYTGSCDVVVDGITWSVGGNAQLVPWKFGGKNITKVDRALYSKTAYPKALTGIKITFGDSDITINSCKLVYSTNADFTDNKECNINFKASSTVEVTENFPANVYYKLVFNVTNTTGSNKGVQLSKIEFIGLQN